MKKYLYILMSVMLMTITAGCSSDSAEPIIDEQPETRQAETPEEQKGPEENMGSDSIVVDLCKTWQLIGYGSENNFHKIAEEYRKKSDTYGYRFYLIFNSDGTLIGRESINKIMGIYTCKGNEIKFDRLVTTLVYDVKGNKESEEFLYRLHASKTYDIKDGQILRIYYSDSEFLYFESIEME